MPSSTTKIDICSKALMKIGASPIQSLEENTSESIISSQFYDIVKESLLSEHEWSFATKTQELNILNVESDQEGYENVFQLPHDLIRVLSISSSANGISIDYKLYQDEIHTNAEKVYITYIYRVGEKYFPQFFVNLMTTSLAKEFVMPLTEDNSKYNSLMNESIMLLSKAKNQDSDQTKIKKIKTFSLISSRN
ncbi:MAG: hypothetical protein N4A44_00605 [Alphaproteobacteria bacterium]|jgi:hypothetical protein|nr:hypothetical protein [Alphaproteobacteria bacterium]